MSEHMNIKGEVDYWHLPYKEEGFSYCKRCKKFCNKIEISFNEGFMSDWMQVNCGKCGKVIWVCEFNQNQRKFVKDDKKCCICKKPTNHYDCFSYGGMGGDRRTSYWCSKKCNDIWDKKKFGKKK